MHSIEALPALIKGQAGYDIKVYDYKVSVQDYLDALNRFIDAGECFRFRAPARNSCFSCDLCCRERIPITLIDALNMPDYGLSDVFRHRLHVYVEGRVVDITMALTESGSCCFLDEAAKICLAYQTRPLVCQTFICCPATGKAKQLREEIVNVGEDELVRSWFRMRDKKGHLIINEADNPCPRVADYSATPFKGTTGYQQVKLRDICSQELWRKLKMSD